MDECECFFFFFKGIVTKVRVFFFFLPRITIVRASLTKNGRRNYSHSSVKFVYVKIFRNNRLFNFLKMLKFSIHLNLELYII